MRHEPQADDDRGHHEHLVEFVVVERVIGDGPEQYPRKPDDAWIWNENEAESQKGWVGLRSLADVQVAYGADGDLLILWPRLDQREAGCL